MKSIVLWAVAVPLIGLAIAVPFVAVLLVMIVPLVMLAMASGWGLVRGGGRSTGRRQPVMRGRHVVTPGHRR